MKNLLDFQTAHEWYFNYLNIKENAWRLQSELNFQTMKLSFNFFAIFLLLNGASAFLYAHPSSYMVIIIWFSKQTI